MTKKELTEKLKDYPDDMEVFVSCDYEGDYCIKSASGKLESLDTFFTGYKQVLRLNGPSISFT